MTRQEMLLALTRNELVFLMDSPEWLNDVAQFFVDGGFNKLNDEALKTHYQVAIDEGVEP